MTDWLSGKKRETLRRNLGELPDLMVWAEICADTLLPRRGQTSGGRPTPGSRPPTNLGVVDSLDGRHKEAVRDFRNPWLEQAKVEAPDDRNRVLEPRQPDERAELAAELGEPARRGVLPTLEEWVRLAHAEMLDDGQTPTDPAETPTITTETGWLLMHLDWITGQQWVVELADDVRKAHRSLQRVIGEGRPEYRPRCSSCGARMADEGAYFTCPACGRQVRDSQMDHRQALAKEAPMDAQSFGWAGVSAERIRKWVERGELEPATDDHGQVMKRGKRHLFHALDVLRVRDSMGA